MTGAGRTEATSRIRWGWIAGCAISGTGGLVLAYYLDKHGAGFAANVAINVSTTVLLAGALFLLERAFVRATDAVVRTSARDVAHAVAQEAVAGVAAATSASVAALSERLVELEERVARRWSASVAEQDAAIAAIEADDSFEAVAGALGVAQAVRAIGPEVIVPASSRVEGPRVAFRYFPATENSDSILTLRDVRDSPADRAVTAVARFNVFDRLGGVDWADEMELADVFNALKDGMVRQGAGKRARQIEPAATLRNLHAALLTAVTERRADADAWSSGATVIEWLYDGWIITAEGLEVRGHGVVVSASTARRMGIRGGGDAGPPRPSWAPEDLWRIALLRVTRDTF